MIAESRSAPAGAWSSHAGEVLFPDSEDPSRPHPAQELTRTPPPPKDAEIDHALRLNDAVDRGSLCPRCLYFTGFYGPPCSEGDTEPGRSIVNPATARERFPNAHPHHFEEADHAT